MSPGRTTHCPSRDTHFTPVPEQSSSPAQVESLPALTRIEALEPPVSVPAPSFTQRLLEHAPPVEPQSLLSLQVNGTSASTCGKYCKPTPMSFVSGACTNAWIDLRTAVHLS